MCTSLYRSTILQNTPGTVTATTGPAHLAVQLVGADAEPRGRRLRLPVGGGGGVGAQQVQRAHVVDVEVLVEPQGALQHADGVRRLFLQLPRQPQQQQQKQYIEVGLKIEADDV